MAAALLHVKALLHLVEIRTGHVRAEKEQDRSCWGCPRWMGSGPGQNQRLNFGVGAGSAQSPGQLLPPVLHAVSAGGAHGAMLISFSSLLRGSRRIFPAGLLLARH